MGILTHSAINRQNMLAQDMFEETSVQVFSKKTGQYLGLIREESNFSDEQDVYIEPEEVEEPNPNQLQLF